jgi:Transposase IS4
LSGPRHGLNAATAKPFNYFPLFIPIFFYKFCATYTNTKADLECNKKEGNVLDWQPTSTADIKAWFVTVMWFCFMKGLSIENYLKGLNHHINMDNYYTSIPLFQKLEQMFIWCTGTVRVNRKGLDKEVCIN